MIFLGQLDPEAVGPGIEFATHYEPTPPADFAQLMRCVPNDFDLRSAAFVDIGSGMGRVVMLASHYPFKQIIGVEISPALHEIGRANLAAYVDARQLCRDVHLVRADVEGFTLPRGDLLLYLYNPFTANMLSTFVGQLIEQPEQRDVLLMYHTPVERAVIESNPVFDVVVDLGFGAVYRAKLPASASAETSSDRPDGR